MLCKLLGYLSGRSTADNCFAHGQALHDFAKKVGVLPGVGKPISHAANGDVGAPCVAPAAYQVDDLFYGAPFRGQLIE